MEQTSDQLEVLDPGEPLVDRGVLAGQPDSGPGLTGVATHVDAVDERPAAVGAQQGAEDAHRGGLAGPVGAEDAEHGGSWDLEADASQRLGVAESLDEAVGDDGGIGGCHGGAQ